jgi:hypothetical protein
VEGPQEEREEEEMYEVEKEDISIMSSVICSRMQVILKMDQHAVPEDEEELLMEEEEMVERLTNWICCSMRWEGNKLNGEGRFLSLSVSLSLSTFVHFSLLLSLPRVIRLDNHEADNRYITGAYLASVFSKNGLKLSFSNLKLLVDNYSVPKDILAKDPTLVEVHPPPLLHLCCSYPSSLSLSLSLTPSSLRDSIASYLLMILRQLWKRKAASPTLSSFKSNSS